MAEVQSTTLASNNTIVISNTGPLISVFQSNSFELLTHIFAEVWISAVCCSELVGHGWVDAVQTAGSRLVIVELTVEEKQAALSIAQQIARHPDTNDPVAENHLGEAQVMIVAQRNEHQNGLLLLDELAARAVAKQHGIRLSRFPGVLLLAVQHQLISAEDLKERLEICRLQGTHYGVSFIQQVYEMAKQGRR